MLCLGALLRSSVQFSPEFTAAVEAKQIAQQEAQRAAFIVDRAVQEKQGTPSPPSP
jgi:hypothetical protein